MSGRNFQAAHSGNFSIGAGATPVVLPAASFPTMVVSNPSATDGIWFTQEGVVEIPATGTWGANEGFVAPGTVQAFDLAPGNAALSMISTGGAVVVNISVGRGR